MLRPQRIVLLVLPFFALLLIALHARSQPQRYASYLPFQRFSNSSVTSVDAAAAHLLTPRPRATFVTLAREKDLHDILRTLSDLESTFNSAPHARYPYLFLSDPDKPFSAHFQHRINALLSNSGANATFAEIPREHWDVPGWINTELMKARFREMKQKGVLYGDSLTYRKMCRYEAGFFWRHPLLDEMDYYWRVEPGVEFMCDIKHADPFRYMRDNQKMYGFTLTMTEAENTVKTLWQTVLKWLEKNEHFVVPDNAMGFITKPHRNSWNKCHFWSNFEIANLSLWRSPAYRSFFNFLDQRGGIFYERWGDAPIHTIAATMFLRKEQLHYFDSIGYYHNPLHHCPRSKELASKCACDPHINWDYDKFDFACKRQWNDLHGVNTTEVILGINAEDGIVNAAFAGPAQGGPPPG